MKLSDLAKRTAELKQKSNHSILIYGPPKTGKTALVGTAAKIPELKRIFWFDGENGSETLLNMGLTDEEMDKVFLYKIPDVRELPRFGETVLKAFSSKTPIMICDLHGKVDCIECQDKTTKKFTGTSFCLKDCTHEDLIVIDSGSQLGDSCMNIACLGKPLEYKPGWDEYAIQGKYLGDILSVMQACANTNFVMISHLLVMEEEVNGVKRDKFYPLVGSKAFSAKVAKYFGTVVFTEIKLGKHAAGSSSTYKTDTITGSRVRASIEKGALDMQEILIKGGIL